MPSCYGKKHIERSFRNLSKKSEFTIDADQWWRRAKSTRHILSAGVIMVDVDVDLKRLCSQVDGCVVSHRVSPQPVDVGVLELRIACRVAQLRRSELSSKECPSEDKSQGYYARSI